MSRNRSLVAVVALSALLVALWLAGLVALIWAALPASGQQDMRALVPYAWPLVLMGWLMASAALVWAWRHWVAQPRQSMVRLAEQTQALLVSDVPPASTESALQPLTEAIAALGAQRDALRVNVAMQVRDASQRVQAEKDRLSALITQLPQSVLVCNVQGRILLYNQLAHEQFGADVGIGRSIHALIAPALLQHARNEMGQRVARGTAGHATQLVTYTREGQLLRVVMTPVLAGIADQASEAVTEQSHAQITGFVLLIDDVTRSFAEESERDHLLAELTEGSRASLAAIRAAVEMLAYDDIEPAMRKRFLAVVHDESARMGTRIDELAGRATHEVRTRWPLQDMLGDDFVAAAQAHIQSSSACPTSVAEVTPGLWLRVDSYGLLQALAYLAGRLKSELTVARLELRLQPATVGRAYLDLVWLGSPMSTEAAMGWELDPIQTDMGDSRLTVRDVVQRHDGEIWFQRERARHQSFFRFLLPVGQAHELDAGTDGHASRPEFYDFDLFQHHESDGELDIRRLSDLRFTVFDTETTGLNPNGGDAIIQIGAVRIVNGRLLPQETFDRLVNPQRDIPDASVAIHGITEKMVAGQPTIDVVLPAFHRFAEDSVLVGHNAAFDMKFFQLLEAGAGVVFDQPVLDTLLLSAVVHPHQKSHRLEAIAARLGVKVESRHTALGDARMTAEVWLGLMAQLQALGIHTLGEALAAARQTWYARLRY